MTANAASDSPTATTAAADWHALSTEAALERHPDVVGVGKGEPSGGLSERGEVGLVVEAGGAERFRLGQLGREAARIDRINRDVTARGRGERGVRIVTGRRQ